MRRGALRNLDYVDVVLWLFRIGIIALVVLGIFGKIVLDNGNDYSLSAWLDFIVAGLADRPAS